MRAVPGIDDDSLSPVDVETVMLDQSQMRAITGAGEDLSIIPSMDGKIPVDIEPLVEDAPPQCQWIFAETQTFGPDVEEFHKTTFQNPPDGGLISEAVAAYRDPGTARAASTVWSDWSTTAAQPTLGSDARRRLDGRGRHAADPTGRLRSRLPREIGGAGRGHVLPVPRLGARHRDDEHPRERAGVITASG